MLRRSFLFTGLLCLLATTAYAQADDPVADPADNGAAASLDPAVDDVPPVTRNIGEVIAITRGERGNLETPGNITVLDRQDIEQSGARDVPDLLRREAGIFVTNDSTNRKGYRLEMRGFNNGSGGGSSTLVLVDGRRVNEASSSATDWSLIAIDEIERIEIVRGPVNSAWGDNSQAGVINISTRSGDGPPRLEARGRWGSYDSYGTSVFAGGSHGPVRASGFFNLDKSDGYRERSDFRIHQGTIKLGFDLANRATLDFKGAYSSDRSESPGVLSEEQMDFLGRRAAQPGTDDNFTKTRTYDIDGTLRVFLAEAVTWRTTAWYDSRRDKGQLGNTFFRFDSDSETQAIGVNNQLEVRRPIFGHANQLVIGGDWLQEKVARDSVFKDLVFLGPDSPSKSRVTRTTYGFFLQNDLNILEPLILSAGVRYDTNERQGDDPLNDTDLDDDSSAWAPRAALTWRAMEALSVYASWSRGYRFPNVNETFDFFGLTPALDTERSETWEIGAKWRNAFADANVALYHMNVRDEIFANPLVSPTLIPTSVNLDRVRHRGVEFSTALRPMKWIEIYGSYTYDDVEIRRDTLTMLDGAHIPMVPKNRGTAGVRFFGPCETEAGMNANFVGSRPFLNDVGNNFGDLDAFQVVDAHLAWRPWIGEHVRLGVEFNVYNVLDTEYEEVGALATSFDPITFAPAQVERFYPSPNRNYDFRILVEIRR